MWSVVEKTALAEAEVEYEDYTSDHGVGEVSDRVQRTTCNALNRLAENWRFGRHLDHHALDDAGQPRHQLTRRRLLTASIEVTEAPEENWARSAKA